MKKRNTTGKALTISIVATFLCIVLLFGMTYAWFTSSVDSGNNVIKTGAFDVEVKFNKAYTDAWQTFENGVLFAGDDEDTTLLPGNSVIRYVKFVNKCDYPVKFDLVLPQFTAETVASSFDLYYKDSGVSAAIASTAEMTKLDTLADLNPASASTPTRILSVVVEGKGADESKEAVVAVALKLPESYDVASATEVSQNFVFRVIATQYNVPHDSVTAASSAAQTLTVDNVTVVVPASTVAADDVFSLIVTDVDTSVDGVFSCDITLNKNGEAVVNDGTPYTVSIVVGEGKAIDEVTHNGNPVPFTYSGDTITFTTTSFSPFSVKFIADFVSYDTDKSLKENVAAALAENKPLLLTCDLTISDGYENNRYFLEGGANIIGNGHTINVTKRGLGLRGVDSNADFMFKNVNIVNPQDEGRCIDTRGKINSLTLEGVSLNATGSGWTQPLTIGGNQSQIASVTIKNSTITTAPGFTNGYAITTFNPVDMTIEGSTIAGWACLNIKAADSSAGSNGSTFALSDCTLESNNGTPGNSNAYCAIKIEDNNVSVTGDKLHISINGADNHQSLLSCQKLDHTVSTNCSVVLTNTEIVLLGDSGYTSNVEPGTLTVNGVVDPV